MNWNLRWSSEGLYCRGVSCTSEENSLQHFFWLLQNFRAKTHDSMYLLDDWHTAMQTWLLLMEVNERNIEQLPWLLIIPLNYTKLQSVRFLTSRWVMFIFLFHLFQELFSKGLHFSDLRLNPCKNFLRILWNMFIQSQKIGSWFTHQLVQNASNH